MSRQKRKKKRSPQAILGQRGGTFVGMRPVVMESRKHKEKHKPDYLKDAEAEQ